MPRESKESKKAPPINRWKLGMGIAIFLAVAVSTGLAARRVQQYVASDPQFVLSRYQKGALTVEGLNYAPRSKVQRVFALDFDRSIFSVPLEERRRRLLAIDWVEEASVSRVWPDHLVVRIRERHPIAFVPLGASVLLIDPHGVLLDQPPQAQFAFPVLRGIRVDSTEAQRQEQVRLMMNVEEDMAYLAKDLSEVNVSDPDNIRIVVQVERRTVELLLGDANFGRRYQNFLKHFPDIQKQSPGVKTFDLRLDDRITAKD